MTENKRAQEPAKPSFKRFIEFIGGLKGYYLNEAECPWVLSEFQYLNRDYDLIRENWNEAEGKIESLESKVRELEKVIADQRTTMENAKDKTEAAIAENENELKPLVRDLKGKLEEAVSFVKKLENDADRDLNTAGMVGNENLRQYASGALLVIEKILKKLTTGEGSK